MPGVHSLDFWRQVAEQYKANEQVLFEIHNEPFGDLQGEVDAETWLSGGLLNPNSQDKETTCGSYDAIGMQVLVDEIRSIAPNTIFVNGLNHGYRHSINGQKLPLINGIDIINGYHPYGNIPGKQFPYEWERDNGHLPRLAITEGGHQFTCDGNFQREVLTSPFTQEHEYLIFWSVTDLTTSPDCGFPNLFISLDTGNIVPNDAGKVVFDYTRKK